MYSYHSLLGYTRSPEAIPDQIDPSGSVHVPVLPVEVAYWLSPQPGQTIVDGTLGGGGHTRLLAERVGDSGLVVALDRDPAAIASAEKNLAGLPARLVHANFSALPEVLADIGITQVDGVLLDLGLSSDQLADTQRGFSFDADGPLDLRFDPAEGEPAWRLVNRLSAQQLAEIIYEFGEERFSRRIARRIVQYRRTTPIRSSVQLADLVRACVPKSKRQRIDSATRTFQALRIAVNDELSALETALKRIPDCLRPGARVVVISFQSLEDRRVKNAFRSDPRYMILTKKPIRPNEAETQRNPRSRSARLRAAQRAGTQASP